MYASDNLVNLSKVFGFVSVWYISVKHLTAGKQVKRVSFLN